MGRGSPILALARCRHYHGYSLLRNSLTSNLERGRVYHMDEIEKKFQKPKKSRLNLWISNETSKSLEKLGEERGVSPSSIAETALRLYLERDRVYREAEKSRQAYLNELLTEFSAGDIRAMVKEAVAKYLNPRDTVEILAGLRKPLEEGTEENK